MCSWKWTDRLAVFVAVGAVPAVGLASVQVITGLPQRGDWVAEHVLALVMGSAEGLTESGSGWWAGHIGVAGFCRPGAGVAAAGGGAERRVRGLRGYRWHSGGMG